MLRALACQGKKQGGRGGGCGCWDRVGRSQEGPSNECGGCSEVGRVQNVQYSESVEARASLYDHYRTRGYS